MVKKYFLLILISLFLSNLSYAAGGDEDDGENNKVKKLALYKKGMYMVKQGKKLEKKGKIEKAKIKYKKAIEFLVDANFEEPNQPDILNYLGFSHRKIGDFVNAEVYYKLGLDIDPNHVGINEYLGELYVQTNRINEANERLKILEKCNCKEYDELKNVINSGNSNY